MATNKLMINYQEKVVENSINNESNYQNRPLTQSSTGKSKPYLTRRVPNSNDLLSLDIYESNKNKKG